MAACSRVGGSVLIRAWGKLEHGAPTAARRRVPDEREGRGRYPVAADVAYCGMDTQLCGEGLRELYCVAERTHAVVAP